MGLRVVLLSLVLVGFSVVSVSAQEQPILLGDAASPEAFVEEREPSRFQMSLSGSFVLAADSATETVYGHDGEPLMDAGLVGFTLTTGALVGRTPLGNAGDGAWLLGYRGHVSVPVVEWFSSNLGLRHDHELNAVLAIPSGVELHFGAGVALEHRDQGMVIGAAMHLDVRLFASRHFHAALPLQVDVFPDRGTVVTAGVGFGWQTLR